MVVRLGARACEREAERYFCPAQVAGECDGRGSHKGRSKGASGIATKIDPDNPNAVPIYIAGMKKKVENTSDSWNAYVGTANAEIDHGVLSLPPIAAVYGFSAIGVDGIGLPAEETSDGLPAHVLWPFIASALNYNGTKGPCFFLARSLGADAAGQLTALLKKAATKSNTLVKSLKDFLPLLDATVAKQPAPTTLRSLPRSPRVGRRVTRTARASKTSSWSAGNLRPSNWSRSTISFRDLYAIRLRWRVHHGNRRRKD